MKTQRRVAAGGTASAGRPRRGAAAKATTKLSRNISQWDGEYDGECFKSDGDTSSSEEDDAGSNRRKRPSQSKGKPSKRSRDVFDFPSESEEGGCGVGSSAARKRGKRPPKRSKGGAKERVGNKPASRGKASSSGPSARRDGGTRRVHPRVGKSRDELWDENYEKLRAYKKKHGDCNVPQSCVVDWCQLGKWVTAQRQLHRKGKLSLERRRRLEEIGFQWSGSAGAQKVLDKQWNENSEQLKAYENEYGHCNVPRSYVVDGFHLGKWVNKQRYLHTKGKLSDDRKERLEQIGFQWSGSAGAQKTLDEQWSERFEQLQVYKLEHGDCNVPRDYEAADGIRLGHWVHTQRDFYKKGRLADERKRRLVEIGFQWSVKKGRRRSDVMAYVSESEGEEAAPEGHVSVDEDGSPRSEGRHMVTDERVLVESTGAGQASSSTDREERKRMREKRKDALQSVQSYESPPMAEAGEGLENNRLRDETVAESSACQELGADGGDFGGDGYFGDDDAEGSPLTRENDDINSEERRAEMEALKLAHLQQIEKMNATHQEELEKYNAKMAAMELAHSQQIEAMKAAHQADLAKERASRESMKASLLGHFRHLREWATNLGQKKNAQLEEIEQAHQNSLAAAEKKHREDLEHAFRELRARHERELRSLRETLSSKRRCQKSPGMKERSPKRANRQDGSVLSALEGSRTRYEGSVHEMTVTL